VKNFSFGYKLFIPISALVFMFLVIEFGLSLNFFPDHLTKNYPIPVGVNYYSFAFVDHLIQERPQLNLHFISGFILLCLGLIQLSETFRKKHRFAHRVIGVIYFSLGSFVAGIGLYLSGRVLGGPLAQASFFAFAGLWYFSAFQSLSAVFKKNFAMHRRWTLRNYIATLATGFIRPMLFVSDVMFPNQPPTVLFPIACWFSVLTALLASQWLVEKSEQSRRKPAQPVAAEIRKTANF